MAEVALVGLMAVNTVMSVVGNIRQGASEREQAEFMAGQSREAANRSEKNASLVLDAARKDERRKRQENAQRLGSIRTAFAANGISGDDAKDFMDYQTAIAEENALDIRHEGVLKAMGYREEAKSYRAQAEQYQKTGSTAFTTGLIKAGGALVGGAGSIAGHYYEGGRATTRGAAQVVGIKRGGT